MSASLRPYCSQFISRGPPPSPCSMYPTSTTRPAGRPSYTWLLGPLNFGLATAWRKATTRDKWRHIVDTATLQQSMLWKKKNVWFGFYATPSCVAWTGLVCKMIFAVWCYAIGTLVSEVERLNLADVAPPEGDINGVIHQEYCRLSILSLCTASRFCIISWLWKVSVVNV